MDQIENERHGWVENWIDEEQNLQRAERMARNAAVLDQLKVKQLAEELYRAAGPKAVPEGAVPPKPRYQDMALVAFLAAQSASQCRGRDSEGYRQTRRRCPPPGGHGTQ